MGLWPFLFYMLLNVTYLQHIKYSVCALSPLRNQLNVGTVLFEKSDAVNHCWNNEDVIILNSRRIFQDLIPKAETSNIQSDQYITKLLNYFNTCLEYASNLSTGRSKHLVMRSLADTMGGYLHSHVVPIAKVSFYAGNIGYRNTEKLYELLDDLKDFLHTDGTSWRKPSEKEMLINVLPMDVMTQDADTACSQLILNSPTRPKRGMYRQRRHRLKRKRFSSRYNYEGNDMYNRNEESISLFMPYFDNDMEPNSIALPFKDHNLWSLFEEESVSVLNKYYEYGVNCIRSKENYEEALKKFNSDFYQWLQQSVYPRLNDDKWYPALGGVLRIIAFLKPASNFTTTERSIIGIYTPRTTEAFVARDTAGTLSTTELIIIAVSSAVAIWIFVGLCLVCYRYLRKHSDECSPCASPKSENRQCCDVETCPAFNSQKGIGEKVKIWWKQKFKNPDDCNKSVEDEKCYTSLNYSKDLICTNPSKRTYKRRKKKVKSVSVTASPSTSSCTRYSNRPKNYYYSSDLSSSNSDSSFR